MPSATGDRQAWRSDAVDPHHAFLAHAHEAEGAARRAGARATPQRQDAGRQQRGRQGLAAIAARRLAIDEVIVTRAEAVGVRSAVIVGPDSRMPALYTDAALYTVRGQSVQHSAVGESCPQSRRLQP